MLSARWRLSKSHSGCEFKMEIIASHNKREILSVTCGSKQKETEG